MVYNHVLVLHTDNASFYRTKYVIDLILALRDSGYKVYLMTTTCRLKYINEVPIKTVCTWMPQSVCGRFRSELYYLKSLCLAFYACVFPPKGEVTYVICDGTIFVIPLLKYFKFRVTFINYMVSFRQLMTKISDVKLTPFRLRMLAKADEIIVPSRQCKLMLKRSKCDNVSVLSPCCDANLQGELPSEITCLEMLEDAKYLFTVFGEYKENSNFLMVIDALNELKVMLQPHLFEKIKLIFVGKSDTEKEQEISTDISKTIETQAPYLKQHIDLLDAKDFKGNIISNIKL